MKVNCRSLYVSLVRSLIYIPRDQYGLSLHSSSLFNLYGHWIAASLVAIFPLVGKYEAYSDRSGGVLALHAVRGVKSYCELVTCERRH